MRVCCLCVLCNRHREGSRKDLQCDPPTCESAEHIWLSLMCHCFVSCYSSPSSQIAIAVLLPPRAALAAMVTQYLSGCLTVFIHRHSSEHCCFFSCVLIRVGEKSFYSVLKHNATSSVWLTVKDPKNWCFEAETSRCFEFI